MPTKKTTKKKTTKKPTTKKSVAKKSPTPKKSKKKTTPAAKKTATVVVKENTIKKDASCNTSCGRKAMAALVIILLIINTALLAFIAFKTTSQKELFGAMEKFETIRVGGSENYEIMKEIYSLDAYKTDQKMRLETTLNALKQMDLQATPQTNPEITQ